MKKLLLLAVFLLIITNLDYNSDSLMVLAKKGLGSTGMCSNQKAGIPTIRVMTYNIHRGINKKNKLDLDGIVKVIRNSGADIVALQEVERYSVRSDFKDQIGYMAKKLSMEYAYGKSINILNGQYGNAILSKYPIESYDVKDLPSKGEKRTLLRAKINVCGKSLSFYNTHLGLKQWERDKQIEEISRIAAQDGDTILAGDFNEKADKLAAINKIFTDSANYEKNDERPTFESGNLRERIDYIFIPKVFKIKGYDVPINEASDHYPVISVLELSN